MSAERALDPKRLAQIKERAAFLANPMPDDPRSLVTEIHQHYDEDLPYLFAALDALVLEQTRQEEARREAELTMARQLPPLDVAATHIDILRRKSDDYTPQERDNVAAIVETHISEARKALFAALSPPPVASGGE